jgi:hypothetical protein
MKKIMIAIIICLLFSSCEIFIPMKENIVYVKSFFLGENSFQIKGKIIDYRGRPVSNKRIRASLLATSEWEIESTLNGNTLEITIDKTADKLTLSPDTLMTDGYTIFREYYASGFYDDNADELYNTGNIKMDSLLLSFTDEFSPLDEIASGNTLIYPYFNYVYISEPLNLNGKKISYTDNNTNHYFQFDCNFLSAGWYKICWYYNQPVKNNQLNSTSVNTVWRKKN